MASNNRFDIEIGAITTDLKKGLADARAELNKFSKDAGVSFNMTPAIEKDIIASQKLTQKLTETKLKLAELTLEKRKNQPVTEALSGSYREAQQRLTALGKTIRETQGGFTTNNTIIQKQVSEYNELNAKLKAFDASMGNNQRNVGNYAMGLGNATGVTMEFTRIIQDAPYGMIGIGNNIQQLTANWQQYAQASREASAAQGKTITTGGLLRGALSSLLTPASLLSLGVAAVTSAWSVYTMWAQKSEKATKENKDIFGELVQNLNSTSEALYKASNASGAEIAELKILYSIANDVTKSTDERRKASEQLISKYPDLFKKIGTEGIMLGQAKESYDKLTTSILATAKAQAAYGLIADKASKQLAIDETNKELRTQIDLLNKQIKTQESLTSVGKATTETGLAVEASQVSKLNGLYEERAPLEKARVNNLLERAKLQTQINDLESVATVNQDKTITNTDRLATSNTRLVGTISDLQKQLQDVSVELNRVGSTSELNEWDVKLMDINNKLISIRNTISDSEKFKLIDKSELKRLNELADTLEKIQKQAFNVDKFLDTTKVLQSRKNIGLSGSLTIPTTLTGTATAPNSVKTNEEFSKAMTSQFRRASADIFGSLLSDLNKLNDSTYDIEKKYNELRANASEEQIASLNKMEKLEKRINNGFSSMLQRLGSTFTNMGSGVLTSAVSTGISSGKFDDLTKLFKGDNKAMGYGALASMVGGLVQGTTKKTSAVGQGLGGALAGAGTGAMVGSLLGPVGTIVGGAVGGLVGLIGGIFGSSKAKKEEELQREQLEEQRKQTALMERQALLAYSSSVIGQMTNSGVVTAVDRDAFGNLVANIKGSDIQLVLDRSKNQRGN